MLVISGIHKSLATRRVNARAHVHTYTRTRVRVHYNPDALGEISALFTDLSNKRTRNAPARSILFRWQAASEPS